MANSQEGRISDDPNDWEQDQEQEQEQDQEQERRERQERWDLLKILGKIEVNHLLERPDLMKKMILPDLLLVKGLLHVPAQQLAFMTRLSARENPNISRQFIYA